MNGRGTEYRYYLFHKTNSLFIYQEEEIRLGGESNVTKILPQKKGLNALCTPLQLLERKDMTKTTKKQTTIDLLLLDICGMMRVMMGHVNMYVCTV